MAFGYNQADPHPGFQALREVTHPPGSELDGEIKKRLGYGYKPTWVWLGSEMTVGTGAGGEN